MASIVNILTKVLSQPTVITVTTTPASLGRNPFVNYSSANTYAKNTPVRGGYFAGYYNGKQNIVGQRLFIEV